VEKKTSEECLIEFHPVQRNMDLIRKLLMEIEAEPAMDGNTEFKFDTVDGYSPEQTEYAVKMLIQAGFVEGNSATNCVSSLTWNGHEFLDNIKDEGIWAKTKKQLSGFPGVALSVVAQIAQSEVKKHFGLP
jgi:hypothetical protein